VIWMPHDFDVAIARLAFLEHAHQSFFGVLAIACKGCSDLCETFSLDGNSCKLYVLPCILRHRSSHLPERGASGSDLIETFGCRTEAVSGTRKGE
jgi:hypothetical protein